MKLVQISDTHVTHRGGITNENFERVARFINTELRPDLVVHTGDVVILNPDDAADRETARDLMALISAPVKVLPGNHDVGEFGDKPCAGFAATSERTNAFTDVFGPDHWVEIVGDYAVIGFNSEILTTGICEEDAQWQWLDTVAGQVGDRPAMISCHKPFWSPLPGYTDHNLAIPEATREAMLAALDGVSLIAFGSGHLHHYSIATRGDAITVSAPSTAFVVTGGEHADMLGPGLNQLGVVEYRCEDGGVQAYFRAPADLIEGSPLEFEAFNLALAETGVTVDL